jgi:hypothetical protein
LLLRRNAVDDRAGYRFDLASTVVAGEGDSDVETPEAKVLGRGDPIVRELCYRWGSRCEQQRRRHVERSSTRCHHVTLHPGLVASDFMHRLTHWVAFIFGA